MAKFKQLGDCVFVLWELAPLRPPPELESADEESGDWEEWQAGGAAEGKKGNAAQCLSCSDAMPSPEAVFQHCLEVHSFELLQARVYAYLGFYDTLRLINLIRSQSGAPGVSSGAKGIRV